jgi:hypothetical protein
MLRRSFTGGLLIDGGVLAAAPPGAIAAVVRCGADGLGGVDFPGYVDAFNRGDFARLGEYYADNVDFQGRGGRFHSREEVLDFYRSARPRLRETLTILDAVIGPQGIVVDMLTELQALEDWPDFPTGALRKGDTRRSENFIWYEVADGQFTRIRSAHYGADNPGIGPETTPRVAGCAEPVMTAAQFSSYIGAFNHDDYAHFGDYYDESVILVIAGRKELRGRQAIF